MAPLIEMKVDVQQFKQLADTLKEFNDKDLRLGVRAAVKDAIKPMERAAQRGAPVGETTQLARSIGNIIRQYPRKGITVGIVGARKGFKKQVTTGSGRTKNIEPRNYLHLVVLGHKIVTRKKRRGISRLLGATTPGRGGFVKGNKFLQKALRRVKRRVLSTYSTELGRRVDIATKRAAKKIRKSRITA